jgi:hypothetical protein
MNLTTTSRVSGGGKVSSLRNANLWPADKRPRAGVAVQQ